MNKELDFIKLEKVMKSALLKAGKVVKEGFLLEEKGVNYKDDYKLDVVTKYDLMAEKIIVETITKSYSNFNILAEEKSTINKDSIYTWIIDPIDGTRNYSRGIPLFMITLALAKKNDVIMCACYNPISKEFYFAKKGAGAYLNGKQIYVSKNKLEQSDVILTAGGDKTLKKKIFYILLENSISIRNYYSLVYSTALVGNGKIDALVSTNAKPWDYCTYLLIEEAGGKVTTFSGKKFDITKKNIIMSNKIIHKQLIEKLKDLENG